MSANRAARPELSLRPRRNQLSFNQAPFVTRGKLPTVAISAAATALSAASTTAAATTTISSAATTATAARAASAGASLVNLDSPPFQIGVVESLDCVGRLGRIRHLDEPEAARLPRKLVGDDDRALNFPGLGKQVCQVFLRNRVGEVAYIQLSGHKSPSFILPGSSYTDDDPEF
jgi:hypothetical protein